VIIDIGMQQISKQLNKEWLEMRGTVAADGIYTQKRVAILDRYSFRQLAIRYSSHIDGKWRWRTDAALYPLFERENRFMAIATDEKKIYNAEVFDYLSLYEINVTVNLI